ncbi:hypothetical protein SCACP_00950 [Sporomusa carbonis]|uniref:hypothetical protein n=1 Tax=Sporomusa carbonis TaxID=3076075 RepID=UPI003A636CC5
MADSLNFSHAGLDLKRLAVPSAIIREALNQEGGVRLGQSSVLSTKVHAFNAHSPEYVQILVNADAGQVFYQRQDSGAVYHLDVFHQCGALDHKAAARRVWQAVQTYNTLVAGQRDLPDELLINPDFIDIQTATGGGRITGTLLGGQKESLRRAHENHVHLALALVSGQLTGLFYIVAAVETAIISSGLEIRRNERISCVESTDSQDDLSPYTEEGDSLLSGRQKHSLSGKAVRESDNVNTVTAADVSLTANYQGL